MDNQQTLTGVNSRNTHYRNGIQPIVLISRANLSFNLGNTLKYICRANYKGQHSLDIQKAKDYVNFEISDLHEYGFDNTVLPPNDPYVNLNTWKDFIHSHALSHYLAHAVLAMAYYCRCRSSFYLHKIVEALDSHMVFEDHA